MALAALLMAASAGLAFGQQQSPTRSGQQPQAPATGVAPVTRVGSDPASVVAGFELARNRGDLDAAIAYFAPDATIRQRTAVMTGQDEIRRYMEGVVSRGRFPTVTNRRTEGARVTWNERAAGQTANVADTSVEAVVLEGKIRSLAYQALAPGQRGSASLDGRGQMPALFGLGSVLLVLFGTVLVTSARFRRGTGMPSTLQGRLLQDLRGWRTARLKA